MKSKFKRTLCLLLALIMTAGLSVSAAAENAVQVSINEDDEIVAYVGQKNIQLTYTCSPVDYSGTVSWSSDRPDVADVDKSGSVKIGQAGDATITLTLGDDEDQDSVHITVLEDSVKSFTVSSPDANLKNNAITVKGKTTFTLRGTTTYASGRTEQGASWGSILDSDGEAGLRVVARKSDAGEYITQGPGEATIEVICPSDGQQTVEVTVTVQDAPLTSLTVSGSGVSGGKVSLASGGSVTLSAAKSPNVTFNEEPVTWTSSDPKVATVSDKGVVKAVGMGSAKITASCRDGVKTVSSSVTVTVSAPSADVSDETMRGKGLSFDGIYSDLVSKFTSAYAKPSSGATIRFTSLGSGSVGTLYTKASSTKAAANKDYALSDLRNMYFEPSSSGSYEMSYTLTDGGSTLTGKITVRVAAAKTRDITVKLTGVSPYTFSSSSTADKVSAASAISSAVKDASGSSYSYIVFDYPGSSSARIGTLYPDSSKKYDLDDYKSYTAGSSGTSRQSPVSKLYFDPKKEGSYEIGYTAYSSGDAELCSGRLIIVVAADTAAVTVTLDSGEENYAFSSRTAKEKISAADAIEDAVYDDTGEVYSYITFGSVSSGGSVGTLYSNSKLTTLNTSRKYYRSSSKDYSVDELYFVPDKAGEYVRSFTAYDSSGDELFEGALKIVVPGAAAAGGMDIFFNTTTGSTLTLGEDVFESWFRQQKGSSYKLAYVTFDDADHDLGTFKHGSSAFDPGDGTAYYSGSYTGDKESGAQYLKNVKYSADSGTGGVSVSFTCYGGTSSSSDSTKLSGTFCIFVTKSSVKSISYDVKSGSVQSLDESSFASVYKTALSAPAGTTYYIELLELPSKGALHYGYSGPGKTGTKLASGKLGNYEFYVNGAASRDSVEDLTYVSASGDTGSVKVRYLARSTGGEPLYVGTVTFNLTGEQAASINCSADGYTFKLSDFYSSGESDGVSYVTFRQPDSGRLMLDYANGRGVPLDSGVRLYTITPSAGAYPISSLSYIPKAGFTGNVDIEYTAVTESGKSSTGTLTVAVSGKKSSSRFKDVESSGSGAWAADAIDFAYKWGLLSGTGGNDFSPDTPMSRAMLVTVLYRAAGSPKVTGQCAFRDVSVSDYFYEPVIWAAENGIASGASPTSFNPNGDVTREQTAAFLYRYAKYNGEAVTSSGPLSGYTDQSSVSSYAVEPMAWAVNKGCITSASATEKTLDPLGNATRAQVAVMLHRFLTY